MEPIKLQLPLFARSGLVWLGPMTPVAGDGVISWPFMKSNIHRKGILASNPFKKRWPLINLLARGFRLDEKACLGVVQRRLRLSQSSWDEKLGGYFPLKA